MVLLLIIQNCFIKNSKAPNSGCTHSLIAWHKDMTTKDKYNPMTICDHNNGSTKGNSLQINLDAPTPESRLHGVDYTEICEIISHSISFQLIHWITDYSKWAY